MNDAPPVVPIYARPSVKIVLRLAAVLGVVLGIETTILHLTTDPLADVRAYYDAGARLNAGLPLYIQAAGTNDADFYRYPPLLAIAFRPLALLPYEQAAIIWESVVIGATLLTFKRLGIREPVLLVGAWLALPIMWTVSIGQAQALITLFLAIGSPWAVALAANIKLFPALAAVYWIGRRAWRPLAIFAAWMVGLIAFQFVLEPTATLDYLGFLSLEQVGEVNSLSLYGISPILWAVSLVVLVIVALRLAPTRWGWAAAVVLSVFATPRLLNYQLSTLLAGLGGPDQEKRSRPDPAAQIRGGWSAARWSVGVNRAALVRLGGMALVALAVIGLLAGIYIAIVHLRTDPLADARAYYDAGARLNAGLPLYQDVAHSEVPGAYYYPPLVAIVFRPLALLPYEVAALIWAAVIVGATVLTFWRIGLGRSVLIVAGLLALPILWTVTIGQAQALITLFLAIGAPWAVALAANIKLFPGLVAVYWVGRREWRRLGRFAAWMAGLIAFQFILEPSATLAYVDFLRDQQLGGINSLSLYDVSPVLWAISVALAGFVALRLAPTRWGWPAAVVLSVFAAPRLLSYQLSTLLAAFGGPDVARTSGAASDQRRTRPAVTDQ